MIDPLAGHWLPGSYWERQVLMLRSRILTFLGWRDSTGNSMPAECCIVEPHATASAKELYTCYTLWGEENGKRPEQT